MTSHVSGPLNFAGKVTSRSLPKLGEVHRAVASLTVPGGQEFHFPHFSSNFDQFFLFFLNFHFSSSFDPLGGRVAHPRRPGYATGSTYRNSSVHPWDMEVFMWWLCDQYFGLTSLWPMREAIWAATKVDMLGQLSMQSLLVSPHMALCVTWQSLETGGHCQSTFFTKYVELFS